MRAVVIKIKIFIKNIYINIYILYSSLLLSLMRAVIIKIKLIFQHPYKLENVRMLFSNIFKQIIPKDTLFFKPH